MDGGNHATLLCGNRGMAVATYAAAFCHIGTPCISDVFQDGVPSSCGAPAPADASVPRKRERWMWLATTSALGFLMTFVLNFAAAIQVSVMFASMALLLGIAAYALWRSIGAREVVAH